MAEGVLRRFELEEELKANMLLRNATAFFDHLQQHYPAQQMHRKYPIRLFHEQRLFETIIDFILITEEELVLIQNSSFAGDEKQWKIKATELKDWLHLSKTALQDIFQVRKVHTLVHFVLGGGLLEVETTLLKHPALADIKKR